MKNQLTVLKTIHNNYLLLIKNSILLALIVVIIGLIFIIVGIPNLASALFIISGYIISISIGFLYLHWINYKKINKLM